GKLFPEQDDYHYAFEAVEAGAFRLPFPRIVISRFCLIRFSVPPMPGTEHLLPSDFYHMISVWTQEDGELSNYQFNTAGMNADTTERIIPKGLLTVESPQRFNTWVLTPEANRKENERQGMAHTARYELALLAKLRRKTTTKEFCPAPVKPNLAR